MYDLGDIVEMKKPHACKANRWEIIRMGADIKNKVYELRPHRHDDAPRI